MFIVSFFLSSNFIIIKAPGIVIGFVCSPILKLVIFSFIISFRCDSFTHPIFPPNFAVSETLCMFAELLNPISKILLFIILYFF